MTRIPAFQSGPLLPSSVRGLLVVAAGLCLGQLHAQVMQAPGTYPQQPAFQYQHGGGQPLPAPAQAPVAPAAASVPQPATPAAPPAVLPSLLTQPSQPAKVNISGGKLTVDANNSSLTAILQQVATSSGMTIEGLSKDERVFGTYGPGDPRDVISSLLEGSGYNIVMFGKTSSGAPSQIHLTPRGAPIASAMNAPRPSTPEPQDDEDNTPQQQQPDDNPQPPPQPAPPAPNNNTQTGVRSPQQMYQELQQMRQQQQQQTTTDQAQPQ